MNPMLISAAIDKAPQILDAQQSIAKTGIKVIGVVSVLGLGYAVYRHFSDSSKKSPGNDLSKLQINTRNLTYGQSVYGTMAQKIYLAMDEISYKGYNAADIFSVLNSMRTYDDMLMLIKTFGVRRYGMITILWMGDDLNLMGWLTNKLNSSDKEKAGTIFRSFGLPF